VAVSIIGGTFLPIAKDRIGLVDLLETLPGLRIVRVLVRMILLGQLSIGLFDLLWSRLPAYSQDLIIVAFSQDSSPSI
jgi:hypothetical protein